MNDRRNFESASVPGFIVSHSPAKTRCYTQCPAIVKLPTGEYVVSHSRVGPGTTNSESVIYTSTDRGRTWKRVSVLSGQVWSNLFLHGGALYIMGTDHRGTKEGRLNGRVAIRRSEDSGRSWTTPVDAKNGRLTDEDGWHTAPVPIAVYKGHIWRAFEFAPSEKRRSWCAVVLSAPDNADLLDRRSWIFSERLHHGSLEDFRWLEGNVVVSPDGSLVNILRLNKSSSRSKNLTERAAIVHVSDDGSSLWYDPDKDTIDFPGGGSKFTIRFDPQTKRYFALVNVQREPAVWRNVLFLTSSSDLKHWSINKELLRHADPVKHAFQYVDWVFDGQDIVYLSRTAYDDGVGGAHDAHDANYITFHRLESFRRLIG